MKIDPKAIGVGQYQHDMPQARLGEALDGVVEDCVNAVGVDVNTASPSLLQRVSGLTAATAKNLVKYREENGAFTTRRQVLKVPKLGPKAFEQCAGFLRVPESASVLDNTGVHPESYAAAEALLAQCGYTLSDVRAGAMGALKEKAEAMGLEALARVCGVGVPTLADIIKELMKPGRDPRDELPAPILRTDVMEARDLKPGMELQGTVRNVIDFGAFVDIGVHQDGLVHISKLPQRVKHPSQLLSVGDVVTVWVLEVDEKKTRPRLPTKNPDPGAGGRRGHLRPPQLLENLFSETADSRSGGGARGGGSPPRMGSHPCGPCAARAVASKARTFPPQAGRKSIGMQAVEKVPGGLFPLPDAAGGDTSGRRSFIPGCP